MTGRAALVFSVLLLADCRTPAAGQAADYDEICHAPDRAGVDESTPILRRGIKLAEYVQRHVKTAEAQKFIASLGNMPDGMKAAKLREKAELYGVKSCPMADLFQKASDAGRQ